MQSFYGCLAVECMHAATANGHALARRRHACSNCKWTCISHGSRSPPQPPQLGALGLGTVLFQFAVGFFAPLIIATTPRVAAAHAESRQLVRGLVRCRMLLSSPAVGIDLVSSFWHDQLFSLPTPEQASRATAQGMWVALLTGAALQAAVWAKAPDIVACEQGTWGATTTEMQAEGSSSCEQIICTDTCHDSSTSTTLQT